MKIRLTLVTAGSIWLHETGSYDLVCLIMDDVKTVHGTTLVSYIKTNMKLAMANTTLTMKTMTTTSKLTCVYSLAFCGDAKKSKDRRTSLLAFSLQLRRSPNYTQTATTGKMTEDNK